MNTQWLWQRLAPGILVTCLLSFCGVQLKVRLSETGSLSNETHPRLAEASRAIQGENERVQSKTSAAHQNAISAAPLHSLEAQQPTTLHRASQANWVELCQYQSSKQSSAPTHRQVGFGLFQGFGGGRSVANAPIGYQANGFQDAADSCGDFNSLVEPYRMPFSSEYRVRVRDTLTIIYQVSRRESNQAYRISVGDVISIDSDSHDELKQTNLPVLPDGTISVTPLQSVKVSGMTFVQLKEYLEKEFANNGFRLPRITVIPVTINLPNQDLRDAVDGRAGIGGQQVQVNVNWDGMVQLPSLGSIPVVGLSLNEVSQEINARYAIFIQGIEVTAVLEQAAPAFAYVLGEVEQQGRIEMNRPVTALQAITQAGGFLPGANLRSVIVVRRTSDWRMIATRINLHKGGFGREMPYNDIFLHDGDMVIVPRLFIERVAEIVDLYFTRTIYAVAPNQGFTFAFANDSSLF